MSAQSGSEAVQLQGKLLVPLSLTPVCPLLVRYYAEKCLTRKKKLQQKHNDEKALRTG